jgi:hypothetical protein
LASELKLNQFNYCCLKIQKDQKVTKNKTRASKILFAIIIGFFAIHKPFHLYAASEFNKPVQKAYAEIIKLRVQNGRQLLLPELQQNPKNACALLVANYADFLTILVSQDRSVYENLKNKQEQRLEKLEDLGEKTAYKRYAQAEIKLQLAMCEVFFKDEVQAAWHVRSAFLILKENQKLYPDFVPNRKSLGLLQVIIGSVPDSYQWVFNILGMRGDIKGGLANLNAAATTPNFFQTEALIYLQFARDWMNKKDNAGPESLSKLAMANPDNLLYTYLAMSMLKKNKSCDVALVLFQKRPRDKNYLEFSYLSHMAADMFLYKGEYLRSIKENEYFLKNYRGMHYQKDAYFKLYLASLLLDEPLPAQAFYSKIKNSGVAVVEEDKYAQKFIENREQVNRQLVKARLHADGGYFTLALATLKNYHPEHNQNIKDNIEFYYRNGRIYQGLGQADSAANFYEKTIKLSGNLPYYFAPNAALQLGYLAQERNDKTAAKSYFKKALSYPKHEYKNSIDSKAKIALSTL